MSLTINAAPRGRDEQPRLYVAIETGQLGACKIRVLTEKTAGKGIDQLVKVSEAFKQHGEALQRDPAFEQAKEILESQVLHLLNKYESQSVSGAINLAKLMKLRSVIENLGCSGSSRERVLALTSGDLRPLSLGAHGILLSPPTLDLEFSLIKEIERVLSENFDISRTPIRSIELVSEPERRNRILRITLSGLEERIIFKESLPVAPQDVVSTDKHDEESAPVMPQDAVSTEQRDESFDRFSRDWIGLEFASQLEKEAPLTPLCYGGSIEHRFVLLQDLGTHESLADHLLKGKSEEAAASVERYMTCLGRFHAAGHAHVEEYVQRLHEVNPSHPVSDIGIMIEENLERLQLTLTKLDIPCSKPVQEELVAVMQAMFDPSGPFVAVNHGDAAPDNVFDYPDKLLLIDFEMAAVQNALLDATYPRMSMPSAWCAGTFPATLLDRVEGSYREELQRKIPEAKDDGAYFEAYAKACAMHMLDRAIGLIPDALEKDSVWGGGSWNPTLRSRVLSRLQTFIEVSEKYDQLPALREMAIHVLEKVEAQWEGARPLDLYPAFQVGT